MNILGQITQLRMLIDAAQLEFSISLALCRDCSKMLVDHLESLSLFTFSPEDDEPRLDVHGFDIMLMQDQALCGACRAQKKHARYYEAWWAFREGATDRDLVSERISEYTEFYEGHGHYENTD